jgi:predicted ArsR family transcriptional regulator
MHADRFFQSTRGKIVAELRRLGTASAADLAHGFGLSPNAVRQQLVVLERDGLVVEKPVRRGPTKPTLEFSLTPEADKLFPQAYDKLLGAVLREVREQFGAPAVDRIFDGLSKRAVEKAQRTITSEKPEERVAQLTEMLRESGVVAEYSLIDGGFALHEHSCPYSTVAKDHPEMCQVIHHVIEETIGEQKQTESLIHGGKECRFEIKPTGAAAATAAVAERV